MGSKTSKVENNISEDKLREMINNAVATQSQETDRKLLCALSFAKGVNAKQNLVDPITGDSVIKSRTYSLYSKGQILQWLSNPSKNTKNLRDASMYMYNASNLYRRLVNYQANMWLWDYILFPVGYDSSIETKKLKKDYLLAAKQIETWNLKDELNKMAVTAVREGIFFGASWSTDSSFFIQKISPDICIVSSISDGTYLFSVDMSQIKEEELSFYPPEFTTMYNEYSKTGNKYQQVPEEISWCLPFCTADVNTQVFIPPFAGTLPDLYDIENYKALQETATEIANYKVLVGRIDVDSDGQPTMDWNLAMQYYQHLCNSLPDQVGAAVLPFKVEDFNFDQDKGISSVDVVTRSVSQYWENCGSNSVLHGGKSDTSGGMKLAITTDSELLLGFLYNAQRLVNRHLKSLKTKSLFNIQFLPITVYNRDDLSKMYKEAATYGIAPSLYFASLGLSPLAVFGLNRIETDILDITKLIPLKNSHTMNSDEVGRPTEKIEDLGDEGVRARDKS